LVEQELNDSVTPHVVVSTDAARAELAAERLWAAGALAIEERAGADGRIELWTALGGDRDALAVILDGLDWRLELVDDAVASSWRQYAEPVEVDAGLLVHPAWMAVTPSPHRIAIAIEPGDTFGLGNHPTTVASLRALRRAHRAGDVVLDVGTGSGVLAIAAARLGAARVDAVDIAPSSSAIVAANAQRNGVGERVAASTRAVATLTGPYDVVIANILAPVLIELAPELTRLARRDLIVSGLLAGRTDHVVEALHGWHVRSVSPVDGWAALTLRR
jgi:ribosomal protein L11 methyltransferase